MCVERKFSVRWCVAKHSEFGKASAANSVWRVFASRTTHRDTANSAWQVWRKWAVLAGKAGKAKMGQCLGGGLLSRCLRYLARLCVKFTRLFTHSYFTKFFTQNSRHFINLSQISSHTQGFFIFLPQIFIQFLLIKDVK